MEEKVLDGISRHATLQYTYSRLRHRQGNNKVFYPRTFYLATKLAPIFRLTKQKRQKNALGNCIGIFSEPPIYLLTLLTTIKNDE